MSFILILSTFTSFSQTDKKSKEILDGVSAKYKSFQSMKATFSYTLDNPKDKIKDTQNGVISIKGTKYKVEISGQEIISDGKSVWTYLKDANEVQISEPVKGSDAITPNNIFTIYEKGFKSKFVEEKTLSGIPVQIIELVPEDNKKPFFKIQLTINKKDQILNEIKIYDRNGNHYTYAIAKFIPNAVTTESIFTFNAAAHPGVDVIDLR